jgi:hypothetical protein
MKKLTRKSIVLGAAMALTLFTVTCGDGGGDSGDNGNKTTFTSMDAFNKWLEKQSANTPDNPYRVKLNIKDGLGGHLLRYWVNGGKYVYLDISDSTITSIGEAVFCDCDTLVGITIGNTVSSIGDSAFYESGLTSVIIPDSVSSIGDFAFYESGLTSVTIPDSITSIGRQVFWQCTSLASVTIPNSVTTIGWAAFQYCTSLNNITIPNSVSTIEKGAFSGCTGLTGITIPGSVSTIEEGAFSGCTSLTSVTFQGPINSGNFNGTAFDDWLSDKFYETDTDNGTPGTYTKNGSNWTKQ